MKYLANVATLEYDQEKCNGCRRCVEVCPRAVLVMKDRRAAITDRDRCMECGACALNCATRAISVDSGVGCASALINSLISGGEPTCGCDAEGSSGGCC